MSDKARMTAHDRIQVGLIEKEIRAELKREMDMLRRNLSDAQRRVDVLENELEEANDAVGKRDDALRKASNALLKAAKRSSSVSDSFIKTYAQVQRTINAD